MKTKFCTDCLKTNKYTRIYIQKTYKTESKKEVFTDDSGVKHEHIYGSIIDEAYCSLGHRLYINRGKVKRCWCGWQEKAN